MRKEAPIIENGTVIQNPKRKPYSAIRAREFLTDREVEELMNVAKQRGRYGTSIEIPIFDPYVSLSATPKGFPTGYAVSA